MSDSADIGHGILFKRESSLGSGVYTTVPGLITPALPALSRDKIDSTDTQSANRYRTKVGGLKDAGDLTLEFELLEDDTTQIKFYDDLEVRTPLNYRIVGNDTNLTTWTFAAIVTAISPSTPLDGKKTLSVTLAISGKPDKV